MARGLRSELADLLYVDQYTLEDIVDDPQPPLEPTSTRLAHLIMHAIRHPIEARVVFPFFPVIMLRIFGYTAGQGWLETIAQYPNKDREALLTIVAPDGPLHSFCKQTSSQRAQSTSVHGIRDMRFEFSLHNLPSITRRAIVALNSDPAAVVHSYLAPILFPLLQSKVPGTVLLEPLTYFFICMAASPANKYPQDGVPEGTNPITMKRIKRSVSLPSSRALYNQLLASYATTLSPMSRVSADDIFIPAVLDYLFLPLAYATPVKFPNLSAAMADAATAVLLVLAPSAPEALELEEGPILDSAPPMAELNVLTNTSCLYRLVPYMLSAMLVHVVPNDISVAPFLAYMRMLSLHMAPWRGPVRSAVRSMLFPKQRAGVNTAAPLTPLRHVSASNTLSSTFSSINAHLPASQRSPNNASTVKEGRWRAALSGRMRVCDMHLFTAAVVRSATLRVALLTEGNRVLAVLTDAGYSSRLGPVIAANGARRTDEGDGPRRDELVLAVELLKTQQGSGDFKSLLKSERGYLPSLGAMLGVHVQTTGVLHNLSEMVHGGAHSVKDVVDRVAVSTLGVTPSSSVKKRRVLDRRMLLLRTSVTGGDGVDGKGAVPFFGGEWDRPIEEGEFEPLVMGAYWLALQAEPYLGRIPNIRVLGRVWVWVFLVVMLTAMYWTRRWWCLTCA